ncbi:MAG: hypothetical protein IPK00_16320 [Deltaproteobacteria bacterium]|nr:hypothetical protein [Deltaproteobacteria bacterium]
MTRRVLLRALLLAASIALLPNCYGEAPPAGFEAIPTRNPHGPGAACPDLSGTFALASHPLAAAVLGRPAPDGHGSPVRLQIEQGTGQPEAWWQVPREAVIAFARELAGRDPDRYFRWWSLALRERLPPELAHDESRRLTALAELGPPLPVFASLSGQRCEAGWMLVAVRDLGSLSAEDGGGSDRSREEEIWLGRNAAGELLVKRIVFELKHYSLYASATQSIRLPPGKTSWERIAPVPGEGEARLTAADLPPAHDPATEAARCPADPGRVVDFTQRLLVGLPPGGALIRSEVARAEAIDPATGCRALVLELGFEAKRAADLDRIEARLRVEDDVRDVEAGELEEAARGARRAWRVTLR